MSNKIVDEILTVGKQVEEKLKVKVVPSYVIPKRSKDNILFDLKKGILELGPKSFERRLNDVTEVKRFAQTTAILKILKGLNEKDAYMNARGIYYCEDNPQLPNSKAFLFEDEGDSNSILEDVEVLLGRFREELHITSNTKGHVIGNVQFKAFTRTKDYVIDCSNVGAEGARIPRDLSKLDIVKCDASFALVIEKDTICYTLNFDEFWDKFNCVLLTAEGVPDRATRAFVKQLNEKFKLPVAILTDNDPYGWGNIFGVYKCGSIKLAQESRRLSCPNAKFIGLSTSDIERYKFGTKTLEDVSDADIKKAEYMLKYPWFSDPFWQKELNLFLKTKKKSKIDALTEHGYDFLQTTYLPEKLKEAGMI